MSTKKDIRALSEAQIVDPKRKRRTEVSCETNL